MKSEKTKSVFETLSAINVNDHTETYGVGGKNLTYLSWAWAWETVKKHYPEMTSTIYENAEGLNYHHDGKTAWVKTGVTIEGIEHIEDLPVMNNNNKSILISAVTSWDINNTVQRSITKCLARHGLGLYLYQGESIPQAETEANNAAEIVKAEKVAKDQTLINQYVNDLTKATDKRDENGIKEVFSEIAEDKDRLKQKVYRICEHTVREFIDSVMIVKEAA